MDYSLLHEAQPPPSFQIPPPPPPPPPLPSAFQNLFLWNTYQQRSHIISVTLEPYPPAPPPPPPSAFQKKQGNMDSLQPPLSFKTPPPPPPPPAPPPPSPPPPAFKIQRHIISVTLFEPYPPREPMKMNDSFDRLDEASNSGGESPLIRIPPPPPVPPPAFYKSPFVVRGNYVRLIRSSSWRSVSPDLDETESDVTPKM